MTTATTLITVNRAPATGTDTTPTFGTATVAAQVFTIGTAVDLTLPAATGGNAPYTYTLVQGLLAPPLPDGLTFNAVARTITGTPTTAAAAADYTYTAADADMNTAADDTASLTISITVSAMAVVDSAPTFGGARIPPQVYTVAVPVNLTLPLPTSNIGDAPFTYDLLDSAGTVIPDLSTVIPGLTFNAVARTITGTPTAALVSTNFAYRVSDSDANMASSDTDSLSFSITVNTVEEDTAPTFFVDSFPELIFVVNEPITPVTLPSASGGNGDIVYGFSSPPVGLNFEPSTRVLSGTPTEVMVRTRYGYSVRDTDGNAAGDDADTLLLDITVTARADNLVPAFADGASIAAQNYIAGSPITPLTLPEASGGDGTLVYSLRTTGANPTVITDLSTVIPGLTLDIAARTITGTPTTASGAGMSYTWNAEDMDNDLASLVIDISVAVNAVPTFDAATQRINNQAYFAGQTVAVTLPPTATSGNGPTVYTVTPALPDGLTFTPAARTITGTPTTETASAEYTYTARDSDSNTLPADEASLTFQIVVGAGDVAPTFGDAPSFTAPTFTQGVEIPPTTLPQATGGNGALTYTLTPAIPGLTLDANTRVLSGTPTTAALVTEYTYTASDADDDMAMLTVNIEILANAPPTFGATTSLNPVSYVEDAAITPLTLPMATGGNGDGADPTTYTYTLVGALPAGLAFDEDTRILSGTPTTPAGAVTVTYTAHDSDPDRTSTDAGTLSLSITIIGDTAPAFAAGAMDDLRNPTFVMAETVAITLPAAEAGTGNGVSTYTLRPDLPDGLSFNPTTRTITGTAMTTAQVTYTYTATDRDGDTASVMFTLAVEATNTVPAFATSETIDNQMYIQNRVAESVPLPTVETGGNGLTNYSLVGPNGTDLSELPGMTFNPRTRILSGRPTGAPVAARTFTYRAMDSDNNVMAGDTATIDFTIEITHADPLGIVLSVVPSEVTESSAAGSVTLTVTLIDGTFAADRTAADRTITYQTQDGTATAGTDYTAVAGTITIPALTASAGVPFSFTANVDTLFESGGETVLFTATLPGNTGDAAIPITPATLTINDHTPIAINAGDDRTVAPGATIMLDGTVPTSATNIDATWALSNGAAATEALVEAGLTMTDADAEIATLTTALAAITTLDATITAPTADPQLVGPVPLVFTLSVTDNDAPPGHPAVTDTVTITVDANPTAPVLERNMALTEMILPEVARALVTSTTISITQRIEQVAATDAEAATLTVNGRALSLTDMANADSFADALNSPGVSETLTAAARGLSDGSWQPAQLFGNSSFVLPLNAGGMTGDNRLMLWGRGDYRNVSGQSGGVDWDGDLVSGRLGLDAKVTDTLLAGLAVSRQSGAFDYTGDTPGSYGIEQTSIHPYLGWAAPDGRADLWITLGYGLGAVEIEDADGSQTADLTTRTIGGGGSAMMLESHTGTLRLKGEILQTRADVDGNADAIAEMSVDARRMRLTVEGARELVLANGAFLKPTLEVGLRHDAGDGRTGTGAEIGGGLRYTHPAQRLMLEGRWRVLVAHSGDYGDWGISGTVRFEPNTNGQGLAVSLQPSYGATASRVAALWAQETAVGTTASAATPRDGQMNVTISYGMDWADGMLTPYSRLLLTDAQTQAYRIGSRLQMSDGLAFNLEGLRQQTATQPVDHGILLKLQLDW